MWAEPLIHAKILLALHDLQEGSAIEIVECALKSVWPRVRLFSFHRLYGFTSMKGPGNAPPSRLAVELRPWRGLANGRPSMYKSPDVPESSLPRYPTSLSNRLLDCLGFEQLEDIQHMILCLHYLPDNPDEGINTLKAELLENEMKPSEGIFYFSTKDISVSLE